MFKNLNICSVEHRNPMRRSAKSNTYAISIIEVNEAAKVVFDTALIPNMLRLPSDGADASAVLEN